MHKPLKYGIFRHQKLFLFTFSASLCIFSQYTCHDPVWFRFPEKPQNCIFFYNRAFLDTQHIRASFRLYCCGTGKSLTFGCRGISASFRLYCCGTASSGCIPESLPASLLSSYTVGQICINPDISQDVSEKDFLVHRFVNNYTNCAGYDPSVQMRKLRRNGLC